MPFIKSIRKQHDKHQQGPKATDFLDITGGDIVYTAGGWKIHMFTSVGESSLNVRLKPEFANNPEVLALTAGNLTSEYLVIAGGGSGGYLCAVGQ